VTSARIEAAARAEYNLTHGLEVDDAGWDEIGGQPRAEALARATVLVAAIDAADDRIRLTMPEFLDIKAQTVSDLSIDLYARHGVDPGAKEALATVDEMRAVYADRYLDPINHEAAMASLIRERLAASLRDTADSFDNASIQDITAGFNFEHGMVPRSIRKVIQGCADWLRTRADDLDSGTRTPYIRVNTGAVIDEDRHAALLRALSDVIDRANRLATTDRITTSFIMTDMLVEAIEGVGATLSTEE
jgi:hypothetical protein